MYPAVYVIEDHADEGEDRANYGLDALGDHVDRHKEQKEQCEENTAEDQYDGVVILTLHALDRLCRRVKVVIVLGIEDVELSCGEVQSDDNDRIQKNIEVAVVCAHDRDDGQKYRMDRQENDKIVERDMVRFSRVPVCHGVNEKSEHVYADKEDTPDLLLHSGKKELVKDDDVRDTGQNVKQKHQGLRYTESADQYESSAWDHGEDEVNVGHIRDYEVDQTHDCKRDHGKADHQ